MNFSNRVPFSSWVLLAVATVVSGYSGACRAATVYLSVSSATVAPGGSVTVTENVQFSSADLAGGFNAFGAFDSVIAYDSSQFTISDVVLSPFVSGDFGLSKNVSNPAELIVNSSSNSGNGVTVTSGIVESAFSFVLTVNAAAPAGPSDVNLLASFQGVNGTAVTDLVLLNDNTGDQRTSTLSPSLSNGFVAGVDAIVTVQGVPEPSSLLLLGPGALAVCWQGLRRASHVHHG